MKLGLKRTPVMHIMPSTVLGSPTRPAAASPEPTTASEGAPTSEPATESSSQAPAVAGSPVASPPTQGAPQEAPQDHPGHQATAAPGGMVPAAPSQRSGEDEEDDKRKEDRTEPYSFRATPGRAMSVFGDARQ